MNNTPVQREYFFDSIRAWLMLLGIPFHISLIYSSHSWHVNSLEPSWWLTLFNDFIHAFRMQVFFVISGYFSYMLFLRYPLKKWWKVRVERVGIPMLTAIPLLTLPQFIMLQYVKGKAESWPGLSLYDKYNTLAWELISHLWFLLVLVVMTTLCVWIFKRIRNNLENSDKTNKKFSMVKLSVIFLCLGIGYAVIRRTIFIVYPPILSNGMFNFIVMQTLFYLAMMGVSVLVVLGHIGAWMLGAVVVAFLLWAWWAAQKVQLPTVVLTLHDGERVVLLQTTDAAAAQTVCDKIAWAQAYQSQQHPQHSP